MVKHINEIMILWRIMLSFGVVFLVTFLTINYLKIPPKIISFTYDCSSIINNGDKQSINCKRSIDKDRFEVLSSEIERITEEYSQLGEFSKIVPNVVRYNLSLINRTDTTVDTGFDLYHFGKITCSDNLQLTNYNINNKILYEHAIKYSELQNKINVLAEKLHQCTFDLSTLMEGQGEEFNPIVVNGKLNINFNEKFELRVTPNILSWFLIFISYTLVLLGSFPLIKQGVLFSRLGNKYFIKEMSGQMVSSPINMIDDGSLAPNVVAVIFVLFACLFVSLEAYSLAITLILSLIVLLRFKKITEIAINLSGGIKVKFLVSPDKIEADIKENQQTVTNVNFAQFQKIESRVLSDLQKRYGGEMKTRINFLYGDVERPEFRYTPDGSMQTTDSLYLFEIKHIIKPELAISIVQNTIDYLLKVYMAFLPTVGKRLVIKLVLVSQYDLSNMTFEVPEGIELEYFKI